MNSLRLPRLLLSAAALSATLHAAEGFQRKQGWADEQPAKPPAAPSPGPRKSKPATEPTRAVKPPPDTGREAKAIPSAGHTPRATTHALPPSALPPPTLPPPTLPPPTLPPPALPPPAPPPPAPEAATASPAGTPPSSDLPDSASLSDLREEIRNLTTLLRDIAAKPTSGKASAGTHEAAAAGPSAPPPVPSVPPVNAGAHPVPAAPAAPGPAAAPLPALNLMADIQIQGERRLTAASDRDNLDDFWGRLNFGAEYKTEGFQSKANIRVFPEGFGFEPLTGATFDTSGQGALKTQSQPAARVVVNHAWVRTASGPLHARVGRFETQESHSASYGNYIDLGPSGRFLARPAAHNALEAGFTQGPHASTVLLGTGDRRLNRGFVRLFHRYRAPSGLDAAVGWRANVFDQLKFPDDEVLHRFDVNVLLPLPQGFAAFAEAAVLQAAGREDDIPLLLGLRLPAAPWLDFLSLEAEYMSTRKAEREDKPLLLNLHARKAFGRARFETSLFSDHTDKDETTFGLGLRMTTTLK